MAIKKSGRVHTHKFSDIPEKDLSKEKMVYSKIFDVKRKLCIRWPLLTRKLQISLYKNYLTFMNNTYSDDPQYGSVKYLKSWNTLVVKWSRCSYVTTWINQLLFFSLTSSVQGCHPSGHPSWYLKNSFADKPLVGLKHL